MTVADIRDNAFVKRLLQPKNIPLLFAVTIMSGIFYHYAASYTWLWILLSVVVQGLLFKLFDYVNRHHFLGGIFYLAIGAIFLAAAIWLMGAGYESGTLLGPANDNAEIWFFVWFLTPQSVLVDTYPGYTLALFLLFSYFIASISYYFTIVRYRVLMSFMVMMFPFAIYAKESENMPVPAIIILLLCYFAVMIYCRQAHGEHPELVQVYEPNVQSRLTMPPRKSENADKTPELLDRGFMRAGGIFLAAACIVILIIPKPAVQEDRSMLDSMLDMSTLSDYLENAISGFAENSTGGTNFTQNNYSRALYYADADEEEIPVDLRVRTFSNYTYADNTWASADYDGVIPINDPRYHAYSGAASTSFAPGDLDQDNVIRHTVFADQQPLDLISAVQEAARYDTDFASRWGISGIADAQFNVEDYIKGVYLEATTFNYMVYPSANHTIAIETSAFQTDRIYQNESGILFRDVSSRLPRERISMYYYSDAFSRERSAQMLMQTIPTAEWANFLLDLQAVAAASGSETLISSAQDAVDCYLAAQDYAGTIVSETPARVKALAEEVTAGCTTDYEKTAALYNYLKFGEFLYSLSYQAPQVNNVEYFLFEGKTGVCFQFASAMAEMSRAVGLPTRYIEGYMLSERNNSLTSEYSYVITTDQAHAFVEVYLTGYGWLMVDATAPSSELGAGTKSNVLVTLQYSGLILFGAALLVIFVFTWLLPRVLEAAFRAKCRRLRNAESVQAAFARLRKQWKADPAKTARELCVEQGAFMGLDLGEMCDIFEKTLYANRCTPEDADKFYEFYCKAQEAWKPAVKRAEKERRAAAKAARAAERAAKAAAAASA